MGVDSVEHHSLQGTCKRWQNDVGRFCCMQPSKEGEVDVAPGRPHVDEIELGQPQQRGDVTPSAPEVHELLVQQSSCFRQLVTVALSIVPNSGFELVSKSASMSCCPRWMWGTPLAVKCSSKNCLTSGVGKLLDSAERLVAVVVGAWPTRQIGRKGWFGMELARGQARMTTYFRGVWYTVLPASRGERSTISEGGARGGWEGGRGGADAPVTVLNLLQKGTVQC